MSSPYLSRLTKKMAAILGGHYTDKEPIFLDDSMRIRTKKKYINFCLFTLRFLALLLSISLIMAAVISLYKYNKGMKKTVIVVDTGCVTCDFLNPSAPSIEEELKASTETSIHQISTKNDYFEEGNVTEKVDITETRNETEIIKLSGRAEVVGVKPHIPTPPPPHPATPHSATPSPSLSVATNSLSSSATSLPSPLPDTISTPPPPPPPPATTHSASPSPPPPVPTNSLASPDISLPSPAPDTSSTPPPPPPPATPPPSPSIEKESYSDYSNKDSEYHQDYVAVEPKSRSISTGSVYETVMGYVRPVKDFVLGLINRFLSFFSG